MSDLARRLNFFTAGFIGVLGLSLVAEIIQENDFPDKIDDILIFLLAGIAVYWYKKMGFKSSGSFGSVLLLFIGILIKSLGIFIEHADKEALGDDIGIMAALIMAFVFVLWQTFKVGKSA